VLKESWPAPEGACLAWVPMANKAKQIRSFFMYGVLHKNGERIIATHANQALNKTGSDLLILAGDLPGFKFVVTSWPEKYHPRVQK
jgi:hypothetical protein